MAVENPSRQLTDTVVMISPDQFGFNPQTAESNRFQNDPTKLGSTVIEVRDAALREFGDTIDALTKHDITVLVLPSRKDVWTPDAIFPNNWFSTHAEGTLVLYPMLTPNRREERQAGVLKGALAQIDVVYPDLLDLTNSEREGNVLEGTGSLVLDRVNHVAFGMESPRTNQVMFNEWCNKMGYKGVFFHAYDKDSFPIYHTNVVMSVGDQFAVWCPESIREPAERMRLAGEFADLGKETTEITVEQLNQFSGNILQLTSTNGDPKLVMSNAACRAFTPSQKVQLEKHGEIVAVNIPTIEKVGGGSARCMLAEVFSPEQRVTLLYTKEEHFKYDDHHRTEVELN